MPFSIAGGSIQRSSISPMFSHQIPFGIEAKRCTFSSGNRCGAMVMPKETHFTRYDLRPFFINPCLPILQPDPMRGGMTDLRKIAALADTARTVDRNPRAVMAPQPVQR